jgi:energy-coupling factor transporter ATP-binding protein EcfA2
MPPEPLLSESEDVQAVQDNRPVYFRSIEVENVLCFKSRQTLDLTDSNGYPAQWTVILGDNGVGKTTLLRCLAGMESRPSPVFEKGTLFFIPRLYGADSCINQWESFSVLKIRKSQVRAIFQLRYTITELNNTSPGKSLDPNSIGSQEVRIGNSVTGNGTLSQRFRALDLLRKYHEIVCSKDKLSS